MHDPPRDPEPAAGDDDVPADRSAATRSADVDAPPSTSGGASPVAAPIIACPRCDAPLTLGARYCSRCGTPQMRSGEQAATALARTRRPASRAVRIGVPSLVAVVVVAVVMLLASHDSSGGRRAVHEQLRAANESHRADAGRARSTRTAATADRRPTRSPAARPTAKVKKVKRSSPFLASVDRVVAAGRPTYVKQTRTFALLRAASGADGFPATGAGSKPKSSAAAIAEAERLAGEIASERATAAGRAREVAARQENQRAIVLKLALFYEAGAATARQLGSCLGSFSATAPDEVARRCLEQARQLRTPEARQLAAFRASYAPARKAAGLPTLGLRL